MSNLNEQLAVTAVVGITSYAISRLRQGEPSNQPVARFSVTTDGLTIEADGSDSVDPDGNIVAYSWELGDGAISDSQIVTHTYSSSGTYTISLTVEDNEGNTATVSSDITVSQTGTSPTANFNVTVDGGTVMVDGSPSSHPEGDELSYFWEFGDGSTDVGVTSEHSYDSAGEYTISLTVEDESGDTNTASAVVTIETVGSYPVAAFQYSIEQDVLNVDASNSSDPDGDPLTYLWEFGDGATSDGVTATHMYTSTGVYNVVLTVMDSNGNTDTISTTVDVSSLNQPPTARFSYSIDGRTITVDASDSTDPDGDDLSYQWEFGDTTTDDGVSSTHTYLTDGTYDVTLTVGDSRGNVDSVGTTVNISSDPDGYGEGGFGEGGFGS